MTIPSSPSNKSKKEIRDEQKKRLDALKQFQKETYEAKSDAEKSRINRRALLPAMGLILMVCIAVIAYAIAPFAIEQLSERLPQFDEQTEGTDEQQLRLMIAVVIFIFLFVVTMFFGAAAIGGDPLADNARLTTPPPGASPKRIRKYERAVAKAAAARKKQIKRLADQERRTKK